MRTTSPHAVARDLTPATPATINLLTSLIVRRVPPAACVWLEQALAAATDRGAFADTFAVTARKLGKKALDLTAADVGALAAAGVRWSIGGWSLDDLGRVTLLLVAAQHLATQPLEDLVEDSFRLGDSRERQAVLRALPLLPHADRLVAVGVEACRTSIQPVFDAIACENPYPSVRFPDLNFNQMVLKALFTGVALERIVGLDARTTPELRRMAGDYASERRAAGRSVPADIGRLTGPEKESVG
jgi:hypothetical protein